MSFPVSGLHSYTLFMGSPLAILLLFSSFVAPSVDDLDALHKTLRRADKASDRLAALEKAAGLAGNGVQPEAVVSVLATGLSDVALEVRSKAIELLAASPADEEAVEVLIRAVEAMAKEREKRIAALVKHLREGPDLPPAKKGQTFEEKWQAIDKLGQHQLLAEEISEEIHRHHAVMMEIGDVFLQLRNDRCIEGLGSLLRDGVGVGEEADGVVNGLLRAGTAEALRHVQAFLKRVVKQQATLEKTLKEAQREKPQKRPKEADAYLWDKRERERLDKSIADAQGRLDTHNRWVAGLIERISAFAAERELMPPPSSLRPEKSWRTWVVEQAKALPENLSEAGTEEASPDAGPSGDGPPGDGPIGAGPIGAFRPQRIPAR